MASNLLDRMNDEAVMSTWHKCLRMGLKPADMALAEMNILEARDAFRNLPKDGPVFKLDDGRGIDERTDRAWQAGE